MILGGLVAVFQAVDAEGKALEDIAKPLSVVAKPAEAIFRATALLPRSRPPATSPAPRHESGPFLTSLRAVASSVGPAPNDGHHRATPHAPHAGLRA